MGLARYAFIDIVLMKIIALVYLAIVLLLSAVSFLLYGWDKRQARIDRWRIAENNFHLISLLGGWPGAILGQNFFRHKTYKQPFRNVFWLTVVVHLLVVAGAIYRFGFDPR